MNGVILAISWFLSKTLNAGIVILAVVEAVLMIMAYNRMIVLKKRIDTLNGETPGKQVLRSKKAGIVETEYTIKVKKDWKEFDKFCLFVAMNGNADWSNAQNLFEGVSFALSSTVLGILFAVIFKFVDILFCSRYLNYIDDGVDRFRESYNVAREIPLGGGDQ